MAQGGKEVAGCPCCTLPWLQTLLLHHQAWGGGMLQARAAPAARGAACRSVLHLCGAQHLCARPKLTLMGL